MPALADSTQRKAVFFILTGAFLTMLYLSWMRWGSLYIDTFRDQWFYCKILSGKVVYKDFCYRYGFLPPYIGSFFYRFFGGTLYASIIFGLIIAASCAMLIYRISRFFLDRFISAFIVFIFITMFAFGGQSDIFNFILPYSSAMTVAMLFTLLTVYCAIKFIFARKPHYLCFTVIFLILIILSRFELGFSVAVVLAVCGFIDLFTNRDFRLLLAAALAVLAGFFSYLIFIAANNAYDGFYDSVCKIFTTAPKEHYFYLRLAGFLDPVKSTLYAAKHFIIQLLAVAFFSFTVLRFGNLRRFVIITALIFLIAVLPLMAVTRFPYCGIYSSMPLVLISGIGLIVYRIKKRKGDLSLNLSLFLLFFASIMISLRVIMNFSVFDYGFAFGALALIPFCIFWFKFLPAIFIGASRPSRLYQLLLATFFILLNFPLFAGNVAHYAKKDVLIRSRRGIIFALSNEDSFCFRQTLDYLRVVAFSGQTMIVMPEGVGLNFFSGLDNPLRYETFIPADITDIGGDGKLIDILAKYKVDYIVITGRTTSEYGCFAFGIDYARRVDAWVKANYHLEKLFGDYPFTTSRFGIAIYRRNG